MRAELKAYGEGLEEKREILALNKVDALDAETRKAKAAALKKAAKVTPRLISGVSGEGVTTLLRDAFAMVRAGKIEEASHHAPPEDWRP